MALTVKIRADATHFRKTIAGVEVQANGLAGVIGKLGSSSLAFGAALASAAAGAAALGASLAFIKSSSEKAAGIESLTMQFETLLGSATKAQHRMEEIQKFAASTPFEVADLSATSKLLQTLGGDMLATGEGLRMVGDAAAISGRPIEEVALHIGRVFNAVTSGTSAGDSVSRLQELGLITGKVKLRFEDLAAAQKKGTVQTLSNNQALTLMQSVLSKTEGAMIRLSATTEGKLSNLNDNISALQVAFGTGFNNGLKTALDATNTFLPKLQTKFASIGNLIGEAISNAVKGDLSLFVSIGVLIGDAIRAGIFDTAGTGIVEGMRSIMMASAGSTEREQQLMRDFSDKALGPRPTIQNRAEDIMTALQPALEDLERTRARSAEELRGKQLEEQKRRVDRELLIESKKTNQLLEKMAPMKGLYPTSR
jgi:hypothetical protein